jgi:hypothetical protein
MLAPQPQQTPQPNPELPTDAASMAPTQEVNPVMPNGQTQLENENPTQLDSSPPTDEEIQAHLDALPDEAKAFLAEHLTPEFVQAIGFISGPEVANYLNKYADPDKVLVPVPRKVAEENLAKMQAQTGGGQPQGQPSAPPQATPAPAQPPQGGGMMAPMQQTATPR